MVHDQVKTFFDSQIQESRQKAIIAQNLYDNAKQSLKEEKERTFEESKALREKHQRERMDLESRIDELRLELNKRDDSIRRLEFEVEKATKLAKQLQEKGSQSRDDGAGFKLGEGDLKQVMQYINNQVHERELENLKLRVTKEYEIKIKDLEKLHYERMQITKQETKRAFDVTLDNMKAIYDDEIKALKLAKRELEDKVNSLKRDIVKREGDVQLLQERIRSQEKEKNLKLEHA